MSEWVKLERLPDNDLPRPAYATEFSAGIDFAACLTRECIQVTEVYGKAPFILDTMGQRYFHGVGDLLDPTDSKNIKLWMEAQEVIMVPLGFRAEFGHDHVLQLHVRSSAGLKGLMLANGTGIVDPDYRGNYLPFCSTGAPSRSR